MCASTNDFRMKLFSSCVFIFFFLIVVAGVFCCFPSYCTNTLPLFSLSHHHHHRPLSRPPTYSQIPSSLPLASYGPSIHRCVLPFCLSAASSAMLLVSALRGVVTWTVTAVSSPCRFTPLNAPFGPGGHADSLSHLRVWCLPTCLWECVSFDSGSVDQAHASVCTNTHQRRYATRTHVRETNAFARRMYGPRRTAR